MQRGFHVILVAMFLVCACSAFHSASAADLPPFPPAGRLRPLDPTARTAVRQSTEERTRLGWRGDGCGEHGGLPRHARRETPRDSEGGRQKKRGHPEEKQVNCTRGLV